MNAPRVDVGLFVYNGERFLAESIESLLAQDYPNLHILISDNASTDGTPDIVQRYLPDRRLRYVRQPRNIGSAGNFRFVVEQAVGPYFMAASHDDFWEPTYVSRCVAELERSPEAVLATSDVQFVEEDGTPRADRCRPIETRGMDAVHRLWGWADSLSGTLVYAVTRLDALRRTRITTGRYGTDIILFTELAALGAFAWVDAPLFRFRVPPSFGRTTARYLQDIDPNKDWDPEIKPFSDLVADLGEAAALSPLTEGELALALAGLAERFGLRHLHLRGNFLSENPGRFASDQSPQAFLRLALERLIEGARRVRPGMRIALEAEGTRLAVGLPRRTLWLAPQTLRGLLQVLSLAQGLRRAYPGAHQALLCREEHAALALACAAFDDVIAYPAAQAAEPGAIREALMARVGEGAYELLIQPELQREALTDILALGAPVPLRVALDGTDLLPAEVRGAGQQLYAAMLPTGLIEAPEEDRFAQAFAGLGLDLTAVSPDLTVPQEAHQAAQALLALSGWKGGPLLGLALGSGAREEHYPAWIDALRASGLPGDATLAALGGAGESGEAERVLSALGGGINLCGRTDLLLVAAVLSRCRLLAASENDLVHLACGVGTPQIVVSGGAHFARRLPYAPSTSLVVHPLTCFGCGGACPFPEVDCLTRLDPAKAGAAMAACWREPALSRPRLFAGPPDVEAPRALDLGPLLSPEQVDYRLL